MTGPGSWVKIVTISVFTLMSISNVLVRRSSSMMLLLRAQWVSGSGWTSQVHGSVG